MGCEQGCRWNLLVWQLGIWFGFAFCLKELSLSLATHFLTSTSVQQTKFYCKCSWTLHKRGGTTRCPRLHAQKKKTARLAALLINKCFTTSERFLLERPTRHFIIAEPLNSATAKTGRPVCRCCCHVSACNILRGLKIAQPGCGGSRDLLEPVNWKESLVRGTNKHVMG